MKNPYHFFMYTFFVDYAYEYVTNQRFNFL